MFEQARRGPHLPDAKEGLTIGHEVGARRIHRRSHRQAEEQGSCQARSPTAPSARAATAPSLGPGGAHEPRRRNDCQDTERHVPPANEVGEPSETPSDPNQHDQEDVRLHGRRLVGSGYLSRSGRSPYRRLIATAKNVPDNSQTGTPTAMANRRPAWVWI